MKQPDGRMLVPGRTDWGLAVNSEALAGEAP